MFLTLRGLGFKPVTFIVEMLENFQEQYAWKWMICLPQSFARFWSLLGVTNNWFLHVCKYWYMKIICTVVEETNINDPRSYEHYPTSSWNKAWKKVDFFLQCQYNIKESSDKNNENHYRGNYYLIQYQIQRANYMNI